MFDDFVQMAFPLWAEMGHDHESGARAFRYTLEKTLHCRNSSGGSPNTDNWKLCVPVSHKYTPLALQRLGM
ncbi:hypothetical protein LAB1_52530 [Roseibium sp. LAB1]